MKYHVELKPKAIKDLSRLPKEAILQLVSRLELLEENLHGDIKKLTNYSPEYRMRTGNYRVLFDVENNHVTVYRILHRKEAYR